MNVEFNNRYLIEQISRMNELGDMFKNVTLLNANREGKFDYFEFRTEYYIKVAKAASKEGQHIADDICKNYHDTLVWILKYYTEGLPSWDFFYPWHYDPLMKDYAEYISHLSTLDIEFQQGEPAHPTVQLLTVIPPSMSFIVPENVRQIYDDLRELFPKEFEIEYEGKTVEHQGVALLPFVNRKSIQERVQGLLEEEYDNRPMSFLWRYDHTSRVVNVFGTIENNKVRMIEN